MLDNQYGMDDDIHYNAQNLSRSNSLGFLIEDPVTAVPGKKWY